MRWSRGDTGTVSETRGPPSASFRMTYCRFRHRTSIRLLLEGVSRVACGVPGATWRPTFSRASRSTRNTRKHRVRGFVLGEANVPTARNTRRDGGGAGSVSCTRVRVSIVTRATDLPSSVSTSRSRGRPPVAGPGSRSTVSRVIESGEGSSRISACSCAQRKHPTGSKRSGENQPGPKRMPDPAEAASRELRTGPPSGVTSKVPSRRFTRMR